MVCAPIMCHCIPPPQQRHMTPLQGGEHCGAAPLSRPINPQMWTTRQVVFENVGTAVINELIIFRLLMVWRAITCTNEVFWVGKFGDFSQASFWKFPANRKSQIPILEITFGVGFSSVRAIEIGWRLRLFMERPIHI
ncbi:hypothetical protein K469DRAFT_761738 [Zopfia rhizophila CBS 207.26]|uniref:Uncharacterized protein n=1 Tax=Zopfia rhizophila CBS 207.26 TaxID=1314779 RepID=A0A6A6DA57_9PEZI|nr:hypothetical protein K469DRAFT_761738 [Zopfia rhizophila CBS 207.26]